MSFLEMLDVVNEELTKKGEDAIAFDSDCREGICGMCSLVVNGVPHGPDRGTTVCQLHMRRFKDGDTVTIEPWRAKAFPVVKDLVVDRSAFDRIIAAGGYVSVNVRRRAGRQRHPDPEGDRRDRDGLGRLHRLRRLRGRLQERVGAPLHGREDLAPGAAAAGQGRASAPRRGDDRAGRRRRFRQLLERRRVRSGVPEGDPDLEHRAHDARVRAGDARLDQGQSGETGPRLLRLAPSPVALHTLITSTSSLTAPADFLQRRVLLGA